MCKRKTISRRKLRKVLCLGDFETMARRYLPRPIFGYISGAAETNASLLNNREAFEDYDFIPRVMIDITKRTTEATLLGRSYAAPFGIAPLGISALPAYRGDLVMARAAAAANIPMIMSGSSLIRLEELAPLGKCIWFQAYLTGHIERIDGLIKRVERAGFGTLVITVDTATAANRENNVRAGFSTPLRPSARLAWDLAIRPRWLFNTWLRTLYRHGMPHFENSYATRGAPILSRNVLRDFSDRGHLNWHHFAHIRRLWKGQLLIKGILHPEDARIACEHGADGIIVSNHGGRQLDGAVAPLRVLPGIVDVAGDVPVMMDSGVRRGGDVLKALALGASFVFVGRPFLYAATIAGEAGVQHGIEILQEEVSRNMALLGINRLEEMSRNLLFNRMRSDVMRGDLTLNHRQFESKETV